jgi:hypothetical protein
MLRRVYDTIKKLHIKFSSPECKIEDDDDDDVIYSDTFLIKFNANVAIF